MSFEINGLLEQAVVSFIWNDEVNQGPEVNIDDLITEISKKIITTSQIKPLIEQKVNSPLSLLHACYLVLQNESGFDCDKTVNQIRQASQDEKAVLNRLVINLSQSFTGIQKDNLKAITLLFGIKRVCELVAKKQILFQAAPSQIEQLEAALTQLNALRSRYDISTVSGPEKEFLLNIDVKIQEKQELLNALKASVYQDDAA